MGLKPQNCARRCLRSENVIGDLVMGVIEASALRQRAQQM
jgi:hypothetical protein